MTWRCYFGCTGRVPNSSGGRISMFVRLTFVVVLLILFSDGLLAEGNRTPAKVGDALVVEMKGELAKEYATRSGMPKSKNIDLSKLTISMMATIAQQQADGKFRVECSPTIVGGTTPQRKLDLTAIVD